MRIVRMMNSPAPLLNKGTQHDIDPQNDEIAIPGNLRATA
jgi:hypothetical protein